MLFGWRFCLCELATTLIIKGKMMNECGSTPLQDTISSEQLSADDLLKGHIKRAKKVRAR